MDGMYTRSAIYLPAKDGEIVSVRTWLEGVQIADSETSPEEAVEAVPRRRDKSVPCTPLRRPHFQDQYTELSPTDTVFSHDSIFDALQHTPSSPASPRPGGRTIDYAETDASSVCGDEDDMCVADTVPLEQAYLPTPPASVDSYEPQTDEENALEPSTTDLLIPESNLVPPDTPRIHHLVSCLQCVLAGLSCTRRTPVCSRCNRTGDGAMCLLQRRRMRNEMSDGHGNVNRMPVLLKLWGCDEALHKRKVALAEQLIQAWAAREERKNWALPLNDGKLGNWRSASPRVPLKHPGDGLGRAHYETLRVVEESFGP